MDRAFLLPSELTIYTIGELYPQCLAWLDVEADAADDASDLHVDAHAVAEVDAAGVQLLLSLSNSLQARQRTLMLDAPSQALSDACVALGVNGLLHRPPQKGPHQ